MRRPLRPLLLFVLPFAMAGCLELAPQGTWDNPYDPAGTNHLPPVISLSDTAIRDAAEGRLSAGARSPAGRNLTLSWSVDGVELGNRDSVLSTSGWEPGNHEIVLRATDDIGLESVKSVDVWIGNQPPVLDPVADRRVGSDASFSTVLSARDPDGSTATISWDIVPDTWGNPTPEVVLSPVPGGSRTIHWRAVDEEGAVSTSSFTVGFVGAAVRSTFPSFIGMSSSTTTRGESQDVSSVMAWHEAVFGFRVEAEAPGFPDEPVEVTAQAYGLSFTCRPSPRNDGEFQCDEAGSTSWTNTSIFVQARNRFGVVGTRTLVVSLYRF